VINEQQGLGYGANPPRLAPPAAAALCPLTPMEQYQVRVEGTGDPHNHAREGGCAIFFVSNNNTGC